MVAIGIGLYIIKEVIRRKHIVLPVMSIMKNRLSYFYIISFGLFSGILVFFGIESLNNLIDRIFRKSSLTNLTSVTIVISACFLFAAFIKEILEELFQTKIVINVWENVIGYFVIRMAVIFALYFIIKAVDKENDKETDKKKLKK
jgi:ABC-type bacteriocin/lantibiotic exporter with double-glycine peptidase domain